MAKHTWTQEAQCRSCKGTGLYVGLAERDGAAVVCLMCGGTGSRTIVVEWHDFEGRKERDDVERVFEVATGIRIGKGKDGKFSLADFGGMPYEDWAADKPFPEGSEMRQFTCPMGWCQALPGASNTAEWCDRQAGGSMLFSECHRFDRKAGCWENYDADR
jgi:hypothetical protein